MDHTVLPATNTMPALPCKRSPDGSKGVQPTFKAVWCRDFLDKYYLKVKVKLIFVLL